MEAITVKITWTGIWRVLVETYGKCNESRESLHQMAQVADAHVDYMEAMTKIRDSRKGYKEAYDKYAYAKELQSEISEQCDLTVSEVESLLDPVTWSGNSR